MKARAAAPCQEAVAARALAARSAPSTRARPVSLQESARARTPPGQPGTAPTTTPARASPPVTADPPKAPRPGPGAQGGQGAGAVGGPLVGLGQQGPRPPHAVGQAPRPGRGPPGRAGAHRGERGRGTDQGRLTQGAAVAGLHNHPGDLLPAPISQARGTSQLIEDHIQIHRHTPPHPVGHGAYRRDNRKNTM